MTGIAIIILLLNLIIFPQVETISIISQNKVRVTATIWALASIAREVGGEKVDVTAIVPLDSDPHQYSPKPSDIELVRSCDLFICIGKEEFISMLGEGGRIRLEWNDWVNAGIEVENENPHYIWLYPPNMKIIAEVIAKALATIDPKNIDYYFDKAREFKRKIDDLNTWARGIVSEMNINNVNIVLAASHFEPLMKYLKLPIIDVLIRGEEKTQGPVDIVRVGESLRKFNVKLIIVSIAEREGDEGRLAAQLSEDTGIPIAYLYPSPRSSNDDYVEFIKYNIAIIAGALTASLSLKVKTFQEEVNLKSLYLTLSTALLIVSILILILMLQRASK
ncbi:MAG: metal ABC transporter substrate-binding protein [Candidatus Methanomethylicia archaeon]